MAKKRKRKFSPGAGRDLEKEMRRYEKARREAAVAARAAGESRKQAIAIGLSKARKEGERVPRKKK